MGIFNTGFESEYPCLAAITSKPKRRWQRYIYIIARTSVCMQVFTGERFENNLNPRNSL